MNLKITLVMLDSSQSDFNDFYKEYEHTILKDIPKSIARIIFEQGWKSHVDYMLIQERDGFIQIQSIKKPSTNT